MEEEMMIVQFDENGPHLMCEDCFFYDEGLEAATEHWDTPGGMTHLCERHAEKRREAAVPIPE
ncbi:MAG: hypothetical protein C5B59_17425 [Bacteroidetes bacterium]|nr:MAG: hypothetical protein C5B59_17425 [Bacteroidota bacterium]